jgi:hypothetical protein
MEGAIILHCGIACFQGFGGAIALCKLLAVWLAQTYRSGGMSQIEGPCDSLKILYSSNIRIAIPTAPRIAWTTSLAYTGTLHNEVSE